MAKKFLLMPAKQGDTEAQYYFGDTYEKLGDFQKASEWFRKAVKGYRKAAEQEKDKGAQYSLGYMYEYGKGVEIDIEYAIDWYQKSANQGYNNAKNELEKLIESQESKGEDIVTHYYLGMLYANGAGKKKQNRNEANAHFEKAFKGFQAKDQKDRDDHYYLARMYENGWGVPKNEDKAIENYKKAAEQGHFKAINKLSSLHNNFNENLKFLKIRLEKCHGFIYDEMILKSFYLGLQTEQLLLLTGRPGAGKTSLVREFAKAFGIKYKSIAVQANWTDKSDLLGYYNPIEQNYISTPFLDTLLEYTSEAESNEDELYFICLDEMNLSHIEYYFAEFLSSLQEDRWISLYSKDLFYNILEELKIILNIDNDFILMEENLLDDEVSEKIEKIINSCIRNPEMDIIKKKYYISLDKKLKMIRKFPYKLHIPNNIKFIGTLNQDETTLNISPKVIDRSYVIRFDGDTNFVLTNRVLANSQQEIVPLFQYKRISEYTNEDTATNTKSAPLQGEQGVVTGYSGFDVNKLNNKEISNEIRYSHRIYKQTFGNREYKNWCDIVGQAVVDDCFLAATVLPRLKYIGNFKTLMDTPTDTFKERLSNVLFGKEKEQTPYEITKRILDSIAKTSNNDELVHFWKS